MKILILLIRRRRSFEKSFRAPFILSTNMLYQSLTFVAVADFIRNLLTGLVFPRDTIMHLFGEIISLLIVFLIPSFNEVIKSQL